MSYKYFSIFFLSCLCMRVGVSANVDLDIIDIIDIIDYEPQNPETQFVMQVAPEFTKLFICDDLGLLCQQVIINAKNNKRVLMTCA